LKQQWEYVLVIINLYSTDVVSKFKKNREISKILVCNKHSLKQKGIFIDY